MTVTLEIEKRSDVSANDLRAAGKVPGVVYGRTQDATPIAVSEKTLLKLKQNVSESTIIELNGLDETVEVLIKNVDMNPLERTIRHIDFYAIERGKEMTTDVPLEFVGEAPAEKLNGVVNKVLHAVSVTARPSKLPSELTVDISALETLESKITIADMYLPEGVVLNHGAEDVVVQVSEVADEPIDESAEINPADIPTEAETKTASTE
jgi:large subunit ribosomal protein L25